MTPNIFFDSIIFGFLAIDFAAILFLVVQFGKYKKKMLSGRIITLFCLLIFSGGVIFYGSFIEPKKIVVTQSEIDLSGDAGIKQEINIVLISDTHLGPYKGKKFVKAIVRKLKTIPHDLILLAGDYIYGENALKAMDLKPLSGINPAFGKFAVLGNHDYNKWGSGGIINENRVKKVEYGLKIAGFKILKNEAVRIEKNKKAFILGGSDELWVGKADVVKTFSELSYKDKNLQRILFAHNPDIITSAKSVGVSVILAAHTHGGQIRLPLLGPVPPLPTRLGRKYDQGLFDIDGIKLFITRGIGETGTRARLFAPPEIVILKLKI